MKRTFRALSETERSYPECMRHASPIWKLHFSLSEADQHGSHGNTSNYCEQYRDLLSNWHHPTASRPVVTMDWSASPPHLLCEFNDVEVLILNEMNLLRPTLRTPPTWIFFRSASVDCLKMHNGMVYHLHPCSGTNSSRPHIPDW